jgi:pimeloyl-ACP methyl ester carboxylesterase
MLVLGLAGMLAGCKQPNRYVAPERLERGLVVILPGIEGHSPLNDAITEGLEEGGVNWALEIRDWTSFWGPLHTLRAEERNRGIAKEIAVRIQRYWVAFPDRPVVLVGQSGGGAMAVWVAESLSDDRLKGLLLINTSLSPDYDLTDALERTREGAVNFYSSRDWMMLGIGTTFYGTMDRQHSASAGLKGFEVPPRLPRAYEKLHQIGWTKEMAETGNWGSHLSSGTRKFVTRYVAPFVLSETWDKDFIDELLSEDPFPKDAELPQTAPAPGEPQIPALGPTSETHTYSIDNQSVKRNPSLGRPDMPPED